MQIHKAFTVEYWGLVNTPHTQIKILNEKWEIIHEWKALWDTWAQMSCILDSLAVKLWFPVIDKWSVWGVWWKSETNIYLVRVLLPSDVPWNLRLHGLKEDIGCDILIGMDIICQWDFAISWFENKTTISFCLPSRKRVDFVQQIGSVPPRRMRPNDLCFCESWSKFKNCHGKGK